METMTSWRFEEPPWVEAFTRELDELCARWGVTLAHEDGHGSAIVSMRCKKGTFDQGIMTTCSCKWWRDARTRADVCTERDPYCDRHGDRGP